MNNITIAARELKYEAVISALRLHGDIKALEGDRSCWERIVYESHGGTTLRLASLVKKEPGDKFSKTLLGMRAFFQFTRPEGGKSEDDLEEMIFSVRWFIGVTVQSDSGINEACWALMLNLCRSLDGFLFTGHSLVDSSGKLIVAK